MVGLAVMGQNLALNIARKGFPIAVFNRTGEKTKTFMQERVEAQDPVTGTDSLAELVRTLKKPRKVLLMVKAGAAVDSIIDQLVPLLQAGDMIVDGGNSHPDDTERRSLAVSEEGLRYLGMGVSGGEEGALLGPSLMPGGSAEAYEELQLILSKIAAAVDDGPCVTHVGTGAAGHFVKMVHNGIEYGDMQLIAEAFDILSVAAGLSPADQAPIFARWDQGPLQSYLIEITAKILGHVDDRTQAPMVDVILDRAGQKGTGRWTSEMGLRYGIPLPTIHAAVEARGLSSRKDERVKAAAQLRGPGVAGSTDPDLVDKLGDALYASKICCYAQGMDLLAAADRDKGWGINLAEIARIWKGGCIIRAKMLDRIQQAYAKDPQLQNLLLDQELGGFLVDRQQSWREVVAMACQRGVPTLAMGASLAYFDSYRRARLPQNLTQAQRDYFGAHTYERVDAPRNEFFHTDW